MHAYLLFVSILWRTLFVNEDEQVLCCIRAEIMAMMMVVLVLVMMMAQGKKRRLVKEKMHHIRNINYLLDDCYEFNMVLRKLFHSALLCGTCTAAPALRPNEYARNFNVYHPWRFFWWDCGKLETQWSKCHKNNGDNILCELKRSEKIHSAAFKFIIILCVCVCACYCYYSKMRILCNSTILWPHLLRHLILQLKIVREIFAAKSIVLEFEHWVAKSIVSYISRPSTFQARNAVCQPRSHSWLRPK